MVKDHIKNIFKFSNLRFSISIGFSSIFCWCQHKYFKENHFYDYSLCKQLVNVGPVRNSVIPDMGNNCHRKGIFFFLKKMNISFLQINKSEVNQSQTLFRLTFSTIFIITISTETWAQSSCEMYSELATL